MYHSVQTGIAAATATPAEKEPPTKQGLPTSVDPFAEMGTLRAGDAANADPDRSGEIGVVGKTKEEMQSPGGNDTVAGGSCMDGSEKLSRGDEKILDDKKDAGGNG